MPENAKRREREPKPFPQYDDAAHIDSAAVAPVPPWTQDEVPRGDPRRDGLYRKILSARLGAGEAVRLPAGAGAGDPSVDSGAFFRFTMRENPRFLT